MNVSAVGSWIDGRGNRARPGRGSGTAPCSPQLANAARAIRWLHHTPTQSIAVDVDGRQASRDQPVKVKAFHQRVVVHPMRTAHHLECLLSVHPPVNCQCRDAPGFGGPGTVAPACSPADNWWLVQNMRCVHVRESGQTGWGVVPRFAGVEEETAPMSVCICLASCAIHACWLQARNVSVVLW